MKTDRRRMAQHIGVFEKPVGLRTREPAYGVERLQGVFVDNAPHNLPIVIVGNEIRDLVHRETTSIQHQVIRNRSRTIIRVYPSRF